MHKKLTESKGDKTNTDETSHLSIYSKYISPVLKKKLKKKSTKNNESEISENLPRSMLSNISNEQFIMAEIKELQTRENFESYPLEVGKNREKSNNLKIKPVFK